MPPDAMAYLPDGTDTCPTFVGDSDWHPVVDGERYFAQLDAAFDGLGAGDALLVAGLELDPGFDLAGRRPDDPAFTTLRTRLLDAAARGTQVRVLLAGKVSAQRLPFPALRGFRANVRTADALDTAVVDGRRPLEGCAQIDWSGRLLGSHHQKVVVVDHGGELTAWVAGIDLVPTRLDAAPHGRMRLRGRPWGWHDAAVRLRGPAAARVHASLAQRWRETATLPARRYVDPTTRQVRRMSTPRPAPAVPEPPPQRPAGRPDTAVQVVRSMGPWKVDSVLPVRRRRWATIPEGGYQEIHRTLVTALGAARRYVYVEDQYLGEEAGGDRRFELYGPLRDAAARGVRVVLVGSGTRDPEDPGLRLRPINRVVNRDVRTKILEPLDPPARDNVAVHRVRRVTVHSKIVLVDDVFASIGSANLFSRSMAGVDCEMAAAVATTGPAVRNLRVRLWAEHLRTPPVDEAREALEDLDSALGMWRASWVVPGAPPPSSPTSALRPVRSSLRHS